MTSSEKKTARTSPDLEEHEIDALTEEEIAQLFPEDRRKQAEAGGRRVPRYRSFDHPLCPYRMLRDKRRFVPTVEAYDGDYKILPLPLDKNIVQDDGQIFRFLIMPGFASARHYGIPIDRSTVVKRVKLAQPNPKSLPCIFDAWSMLSVCEEFRQIVEDLEPNLHQFFPLEVIDQAGEVVDRRFFLNPCGRRTFFDLSKMRFSQNGGRIIPEKPIYEAVYDFDQLEGCHLWMDKFSPGDINRIFVSAELKTKLLEKEIKGVIFEKYRTPLPPE